MKPDVAKYLKDILISIEAIETHIRNVKELEQYQDDITIMDAVERRLSIIGEAMFKANKVEPFLAVTEKTKIIALRHILVHEYDLIEDSTIWNIVHKNLPVLKLEIQQLLNILL